MEIVPLAAPETPSPSPEVSQEQEVAIYDATDPMGADFKCEAGRAHAQRTMASADIGDASELEGCQLPLETQCCVKRPKSLSPVVQTLLVRWKR